MPTRWTIRRAETSRDIAQCLSIRDVVFVGEQGVDPDLERDGLDSKAIHYIAFGPDRALGTARVIKQDDRFKFQRVAVLGEARGTGLGAALMRFMMDDLARSPDADSRHFFLSSQVQAVPFYEKLGFSIVSDEYMEAGIPHRDMRAEIRASSA